MNQRVAVIGAGMAGLSAAYRLEQAGFLVTVFEKSTEVGGLTISRQENGYIMDVGALTLSPAYKETFNLLRDADGYDICVPIKPQLAFVRGGNLQVIDLAKPISTGLSSGFLSLRAKLRLVKLIPTMITYWSKCNFDDMAQLEALDIENCEEFSLRLLGQELHDYLVDPIIRLNMFTNTTHSSAVDIVWSLKMFSSPQLVQVKGGTGALAKEIAKNLQGVQLNATVEQVGRSGERVFVEVDGKSLLFDGAVVALPPHQALAIAPWMTGRQKKWFASCTSVSSLTVNIGLTQRPNSKVSIILIPSRESSDVIAVVLEHNKCDGRAPSEKGLITLHMSETWAATQRGTPDYQVGLSALAAALPFLGEINGQVDMVHVHRWEHVDHERPVGHYKELATVRDELTQGRVTFAGYYSSAGIEGAVRSGKRCAHALTKTLS